MNSLQQYYMEQYGKDALSPFVSVFLSDMNTMSIQTLLTSQLRDATGHVNLPHVEWSASLIEALLAFAFRHHNAPSSREDVVMYANTAFAESMLSQNETRYLESVFWRRWCEQGVPDPTNVPLPVEPDRNDFTVETWSYMLSDPISSATATSFRQ